MKLRRIAFTDWLGGALLLAMLTFGIYNMQNTGRRTVRLGDLMDLRGTNIISIRTSDNGRDLRRIDIFDGGGIIEGPEPYSYGTPTSRIALTSAEFEELQTFREEWCRETIPIPTPGAGEPYADVAVRCSDYQTVQRKVPVDSMPPLLDGVIRRLSP